MSIRSRIGLVVGLALLPPLALLGYDTVETRSRERQALVEDAQVQARLVAGQIDGILSGARSLSWSLAREAGAVRGDRTRCTAMLRSIIGDGTLYRGAAVTDKTGTVLCSWPAAERTVILSDRDYLRDALAQSDLVVGRLLVRGRISNEALIPLARRYLVESEAAGIVVLGLDLDQLGRELRKREPWSSRFVSVLDRNGTVALRLPDQSGSVGRAAVAAIKETARADTGGFTPADGPDKGAVIGFAKAQGLTVLVGTDAERVQAATLEPIRHNLILGGIALVAAFAFAWVAGERLLRRPVSALAQAARRQEEGERGVSVELGASAEIGRIAAAFDRMAQSNDRLLTQHETLVRELQQRVPSSLQTVAGMLHLQARNADPVTREQIEAARGRVVAMGRIFRFLYRGEFTATVAFGEFFEAFCRETARAQLGLHAPKLEVKAEAIALAPDTVLSLALITHELITNVIGHAYPPGRPGKIRVGFRALGNGSLVLSVADDGAGMPADYDPARAKTMGLALVQRMAQTIGGQVRLRSSPTGTEVTVTLPAPTAPRK
ncbi:MAG: ATP-binding protein [Rhodospirillaceae bacterium]|nr:ATP-binding protein [Rhodospirillaceae bacterium]